MLNYIWLGMLVIGFVVGSMNGRVQEVTKAAMDSAQTAVELSIGLLGVMCLWSGLMRIAEKSGLVQYIASLVRPVMRFLFPQIPKNHPAMGAMVMNLVANLFGLGNAATPLGLNAMQELQKLNTSKDTASDAMSMFLVLNTSAIQLVPATVIALRSVVGSVNPAEIITTIWTATLGATIAGVTATKLFGAIARKKVEVIMDTIKVISVYAIPAIFLLILSVGAYREVKLYDVFTEGAKEGISTILRILPSLVGLLVAVGVFRASGAMDLLVYAASPLAKLLGIPSEALPLVFLRPISGSASLALVSDLLKTYGADSFIGRVVSTMMGSTETIFYTLAVYFGSVGIKNIKYTLAAALIADLTGVIVSTWICRVVFGGA